MSQATDSNMKSHLVRDTNPHTETASSQLPNIGAEIKPTDAKTLEGSYAGDHRSGQTNVPAVPQPSPRDETGQAQ